MKYHTQQHLYDPATNSKGSCYPTVIACLLDLELDQVPYFHLFYYNDEEKANLLKYFTWKYLDRDYSASIEQKQENFDISHSQAISHWYNTLEFFLAMKGYKHDYIPKETIDVWIKNNPDVPYMVTGMSERGITHVVIYMNGKMIHDPHPSRSGIIDLITEPYEILVKI